MPLLLLDTCALIWIAEDRSKLSEQVLSLLEAGVAEGPRISAISAYELAVKWQAGQLELPSEPKAWLEQVTRAYSLQVEPVTWEDCLRAATLPRHHSDPADRIIIATAIRIGASVVTPD